MGAPSDQAAAERAAQQGEAGVRTARHPPLYAIEPAIGTHEGHYPWRECPPLYFHTKAPICDRCGSKVQWMGPAERRPQPDGSDSTWVYRVMCNCVEPVEGYAEPQYVIDEIEVGFPLRMGGTTAFWDAYRRVG
jgi:hypothetical protein